MKQTIFCFTGRLFAFSVIRRENDKIEENDYGKQNHSSSGRNTNL